MKVYGNWIIKTINRKTFIINWSIAKNKSSAIKAAGLTEADVKTIRISWV